MVLAEEKNHPSRWSEVIMIAPKLDIHPDTLPKWTRLHKRTNAPAVSDLPDREKIRQLERENRELWQGPWKNKEAVELTTLKWVDWFNNRQLLSSIGNIPPAEAEARFYVQQKSHALAA